MPFHDKHFTVEEARRWLPDLRSRFEEIHRVYAEMASLRADFEKVQAVIRSNGSAPKQTGFEAKASRLHELLLEIVRAGIQVKDIERGLVDFPHFRDDEEVYLCWELGEADLAYWHRIEEGYSGRRPL